LQSHDDQAQAARVTPFQAMANSLPGAFLRYERDANGHERISEICGCETLWEMSNQPGEGGMASIWALMDPRDMPHFHASIEQSARNLTDWSCEWRITTPAGKPKWLHGVGRPERLAHDRTGWNVFIIDITQSRRVDANLRDNNERFRKLLDGISNVSVQGFGLDLTTRYWNKASEKLYGYTAKEAIGKSLLDLIVPKHMHDGVLTEVARMIRTGKVIPEGDLTLMRKDGTTVDVFSSHAYVEMPGYEPELYCIDIDMTERREAEALRTQLEAKAGEGQKMEALGTLAGGVAHDFNNIVAAISGNVALALDDLGPNDPARTSILEIKSASRRAKALVQQILAFSRRQQVQRKRMRLNALLEETAKLVRTNMPAGFEMHVHCEPHTPRVLADATKIEQVLLNLLTNAWQAVPPTRAGVVKASIETHHGLPPHTDAKVLASLNLEDAQSRTWACITVSDNGEGMSQATRARIFEPFFTTKRPGAGTGLGLAVVHGILAEHQAILDVQSTVGEGTSFSAYFPADVGDTDAAVSAPAPLMTDFGSLEQVGSNTSREGLGAHIMYVDDDELMTSMMQRLMEKRTYRISTFNDANSAMREFCKAPGSFDLVITDYNMHAFNGLDFARAVKARSPATPVAIASGTLSDTLRSEAARAGIEELIFKPDKVQDILLTIDRLARNISGKSGATD
jgi:PAS domain S-box-containing protein